MPITTDTATARDGSSWGGDGDGHPGTRTAERQGKCPWKQPTGAPSATDVAGRRCRIAIEEGMEWTGWEKASDRRARRRRSRAPRARTAWGSHLRYVGGGCPVVRNDCRTDRTGDSSFSDEPVRAQLAATSLVPLLQPWEQALTLS